MSSVHCDDVVCAEDGRDRKRARKKSSRAPSLPIQLEPLGQTIRRQPVGHLRVITWNLDGLNDTYLAMRTHSCVSILRSAGASVIFLQEVVPSSLRILQEELQSAYDFIVPVENSPLKHFVAMLVQRGKLERERGSWRPYLHSQMGRGLLHVTAHITDSGDIGPKLQLCTTHLESCHNSSHVRKVQLNTALHLAAEEAAKENADDAVIMAGDLNLRDHEARTCLAAAQQARRSYDDAWVQCGEEATTRWTWNPAINKNAVSTSASKPTCRFDRVYTRKLQATKFELIGQDPLWNKAFLSDHWGVQVDWSWPGDPTRRDNAGTAPLLQ